VRLTNGAHHTEVEISARSRDPCLMSTNEEQTPLDAAPGEASSQTREPPVDPAETLSPAVRRLVRQFDLDITGIHGTGPAGRIRVGDVMGLLNGRMDSGNRDAPARPVPTDDDSDVDANAGSRAEAVAAPPATAHVPTTTIFDCDLGRVLAHRKKVRLEETELLITSYFLTALAAALDATPEITAGHAPRFGVLLTTTDGDLRSALLDTAAVSWDSSLEERVRAVDAALRANLDVDVSSANLLVHHYGESGSLLATPTPIGSGHVASIGVGRLRREIAVRTNDGVETPRVATRCYLSLSFFEHSVPLHHANRALAAATGILESWP
jgi:2-oxoglutarate dehydrogenase E2 component (dihydrolipoamide succinyltransferase)